MIRENLHPLGLHLALDGTTGRQMPADHTLWTVCWCASPLITGLQPLVHFSTHCKSNNTSHQHTQHLPDTTLLQHSPILSWSDFPILCNFLKCLTKYIFLYWIHYQCWKWWPIMIEHYALAMVGFKLKLGLSGLSWYTQCQRSLKWLVFQILPLCFNTTLLEIVLCFEWYGTIHIFY